jgi:hypothetical protein
MEIWVNDTEATDDDLVQVKCDHPNHRHVVNCQIRVKSTSADSFTVVLTNPDGRLLFDGTAPVTSIPGNKETTVTVSGDGSWAGFTISGEVKSDRIGDALIQAHCHTRDGPELTGGKKVTVFGFDARLELITPNKNQTQLDPHELKGIKKAPHYPWGRYVIVRDSQYSTDGLQVEDRGWGSGHSGEPANLGHKRKTVNYRRRAIYMRAEAKIVPLGLNPEAPQIMSLRLGFMQDVNSFQMQHTFGRVDVTWAPMARVSAGSTINIPNIAVDTTRPGYIKVPGNVTQVITYDPCYVTFPAKDQYPVKDGSAPFVFYDNHDDEHPDPDDGNVALKAFDCTDKATVAVSHDAPEQPVPRGTYSEQISADNQLVGTVTWGLRTKTTFQERFTTFCVVYNQSTKIHCALREADWEVDVWFGFGNSPVESHKDESNEGHATATSDRPATRDPQLVALLDPKYQIPSALLQDTKPEDQYVFKVP